MAVTMIDSYRVNLACSGDYSRYRAVIILGGASGSAGTIEFHDDGGTLPAATESGGKIDAHMPLSRLASVLDLLRNEAPVQYDMDRNGHVFLGTAYQEPVGEGE